MGLLDVTDDPRTLGLLSLGLRLMSTPGNFGSALGQSGLGALGDIQAAKQAAEARKLREMQLEQMRFQMEEQKRAQAEREQQRAFLQGLPSPQMQANTEALSGGGGPTVENARKVRAVDPTQSLMFDAVRAGALPLSAYLQSLQKDETPIALSEGANLVTRGGKVLASNPKALQPEKDPEDIRVLKMIYGEGTPAYFDALQKLGTKKVTHQPAANVSVNTGQKGYENESKLRNDFKSEPIYKEFQDMQTAHKQIMAGIKQGTPIGDVATATKIMKLLDPGSVVRESELAIAMAAGGRLDRLQNYVQMQISGEKLTPTMRKEFGALADELYRAAAQAYNKKRSEYEAMGTRYGLEPSVLGAPAGDSVRRYNPETGRIE